MVVLRVLRSGFFFCLFCKKEYYDKLFDVGQKQRFTFCIYEFIYLEVVPVVPCSNKKQIVSLQRLISFTLFISSFIIFYIKSQLFSGINFDTFCQCLFTKAIISLLPLPPFKTLAFIFRTLVSNVSLFSCILKQ